MQMIHGRYGSGRARADAAQQQQRARGWMGWWRRGRGESEQVSGDELEGLLTGERGAGAGGKASGRRKDMGVVEWEEMFASEKAKIEAGEDPEGDK